MLDYLSINTALFTIWSYPMSYIEFFGTIFSLWSVWLVTNNKILNWPVGLVGVVLFGALFWQIGLYADFFEQIYFFATGIWGWWLWLQFRDSNDQVIGERRIIRISHSGRVAYVCAILLGTLALSQITIGLPSWFPALFPEPTAFPYLDALTTVMSFAATILLARKEFESWILWIIVDIIGVGLYFAKDVKLIALLYLIFLVLATKGLINWMRLMRAQEKIEQTQQKII